MANKENSHESLCDTYKENECNSQMSSTAKSAQRSYDNVTYELLCQLLHIEELFKKSHIYSVSYCCSLSKLLDKLSVMGRAELDQPHLEIW